MLIKLSSEAYQAKLSINHLSLYPVRVAAIKRRLLIDVVFSKWAADLNLARSLWLAADVTLARYLRMELL